MSDHALPAGRLPIKLDTTSNGEFEPVPLDAMATYARERALAALHDNRRRLATSRRGYLTSLLGAAATLSECDSYSGWFSRDSFYGHVGYGLTAQTEIFGVTPQFFRLDASVPLVRRRTTCLGEQLPDYLAEVQGVESAAVLLPRVNLNVTFVQPF